MALLLLGSCGASASKPGGLDTERREVRVAAAANLAVVGDKLSEAFAKEYPTYKLAWTFGASGALVSQISLGAEFAAFLSADVSHAQRLYEAGFAASEPEVYAQGQLVLLSTAGHDLGQGLAVLADDRVAQFAMANPETAPYGGAARATLVEAGLWEAISGKAVYGQSVAQAKQLVITATGIGLLARSALFADDVAEYQQEGIYWVSVPLSDPRALDQAMVVLGRGGRSGSGGSSEGGAVFAQFMRSPVARSILRDYGYQTPANIDEHKGAKN